MAPSSLDEYLAEHKEGDVVTGRITSVSAGLALVELGEGVQATCRIAAAQKEESAKPAAAKADLSSLSSMLQARWKSGGGGSAPKAEAARQGEIRSFRIAKLDPAAKRIELEET
jgi:small subunit ribosomal protein S1